MKLYLVRHGISTANEKGIILSKPQNGINGFGLSERGEKSLKDSFAQTRIPETAHIYSSDFLRTKETAVLLKKHYGIQNEIHFDIRLRERNFGSLEMKSNDYYKDVWKKDELDPAQSEFENESLNMLRKRLNDFYMDISNNYKGNDSIVIVSHGDPLHVFFTLLEHLPLTSHSKIKHWQPGEIRLFIK